MTLELAIWFKELGNMGVDLFFVLSGYLIYGSLMKRENTFFSLHQKEIEAYIPNFFMILLVYMILSILIPSQSRLPTNGTFLYIIQNLLLLPGVFDIKPIVTVSWSLSYELFYDLVIPFVILLLKMKKWSPTQRLFFWGLTFVVGLFVFHYLSGPNRLLVFIGGIWLFEVNKCKLLYVTKNKVISFCF